MSCLFVLSFCPPHIEYRVGEWLPSDHQVLLSWLEEHSKVATSEKKELLPIIQEFKDLIESDAEIYMLFNQMFTQVPRTPRYSRSPSHKPQVRDYHQMLQMLNSIMTKAPSFNKTGVVGFPINAILDWSMGTEAGFAAFLNVKVNAMLKKILNEWGKFLQSKDSCYVLTDSDWFSKPALKAMAEMDPHKKDPKNPKLNFIDNFQCDINKPHWGFSSWDDFFLRQFNKGKRPVASPKNNSVIANACESAPYNLATCVKRSDKFWIKGQPYSLQHMLNNDELVDKFVGGTVYQAFLSAKSYHRWHSPVDGTIVKAYVQDGTYYSELPSEGFYNPVHPDDPSQGKSKPDEAAPNDSQGYISEVATRAMIFIEADNPDIGLMCFLPIGMAEVSSCDITVYEGQHVKKGEPIGMFHFGGSSHCLIFGPQAHLKFDLHGQKPSLDASNIPVRSKIATVVK